MPRREGDGLSAAELAARIGQGARAARARLGQTQRVTARAIGVSRAFYGRIERGATLPSLPTLVRLMAALDTSADALLGRPPPLVRDRFTADPPALRRLARLLRDASPRARALAGLILDALEDR